MRSVSLFGIHHIVLNSTNSNNQNRYNIDIDWYTWLKVDFYILDWQTKNTLRDLRLHNRLQLAKKQRTLILWINKSKFSFLKNYLNSSVMSFP